MVSPTSSSQPSPGAPAFSIAHLVYPKCDYINKTAKDLNFNEMVILNRKFEVLFNSFKQHKNALLSYPSNESAKKLIRSVLFNDSDSFDEDALGGLWGSVYKVFFCTTFSTIVHKKIIS